MTEKNTQLSIKTKPLQRQIFDYQIARLEAAKNTDYSKDTIDVWYDEMIKRNWTNGQFLEKVTLVLEQKQFGGVKFDDFTNATKLYTEEELNLKIYQTIEQHKKKIQEAKTANINEHILNEELLISEQHIYGQRIDDIKERARVKLRDRLKKAEQFIKTAPDEVKEELLKILTEKNLLTSEDPHWKTIIRLFVPHILIETENLMRGKAL